MTGWIQSAPFPLELIEWSSHILHRFFCEGLGTYHLQPVISSHLRPNLVYLTSRCQIHYGKFQRAFDYFTFHQISSGFSGSFVSSGCAMYTRMVLTAPWHGIWESRYEAHCHVVARKTVELQLNALLQTYLTTFQLKKCLSRSRNHLWRGNK